MSAAATPLGRFWADFRESPVAVAALVVVAAIVVVALAAPLIAPQDPYDLSRLSLLDARRPPGHVGSGGYVHLLGTDAQGRDLLSAILYGLRISVQIGLMAGPSRSPSAPRSGSSPPTPAAWSRR